MVLAVLLTVVISYLVGAIPVGLVLVHVVNGVDLRNYGSGKTGATNVLRQLGLWAAIATLLADAAKGVIGVLIGHGVPAIFGADLSEWSAVAGGLAAIIGHNWPAYVGFRGGRGVATSLGALIVLSPLTALIALPVSLAIIAFSDRASLGSLLGTVLSSVILLMMVALGQYGIALVAFAVGASALIVLQHRDNIDRLRKGEERRLGLTARLRARL